MSDDSTPPPTDAPPAPPAEDEPVANGVGDEQQKAEESEEKKPEETGNEKEEESSGGPPEDPPAKQEEAVAPAAAEAAEAAEAAAPAAAPEEGKGKKPEIVKATEPKKPTPVSAEFQKRGFVWSKMRSMGSTYDLTDEQQSEFERKLAKARARAQTEQEKDDSAAVSPASSTGEVRNPGKTHEYGYGVTKTGALPPGEARTKFRVTYGVQFEGFKYNPNPSPKASYKTPGRASVSVSRPVSTASVAPSPPSPQPAVVVRSKPATATTETYQNWGRTHTIYDMRHNALQKKEAAGRKSYVGTPVSYGVGFQGLPKADLVSAQDAKRRFSHLKKGSSGYQPPKEEAPELAEKFKRFGVVQNADGVAVTGQDKPRAGSLSGNSFKRIP